eukprot:CAMPEP_0184495514 /NCGR_PEP_ID=MMETSP0113_2-20130426/31535_1 /TAXON_ID=91329 /ORGANISM="Norrisiella sphaerica, Strain BC52" /LENGTH=339 /DNA_ID=CAMNT_0026881731 /DNA_START=151 /DNA_END=1167 /DNA_ORIENTATION=-
MKGSTFILVLLCLIGQSEIRAGRASFTKAKSNPERRQQKEGGSPDIWKQECTFTQMRQQAALASISKLMRRGIRIPQVRSSTEIMSHRRNANAKKSSSKTLGTVKLPKTLTMDSMAISELFENLVKIKQVLVPVDETQRNSEPGIGEVALWAAVDKVMSKLKDYLPSCDAHSLTTSLLCLAKLLQDRRISSSLSKRDTISVCGVILDCVESLIGSYSAKDLGRTLFALSELQASRVSLLQQISSQAIKLVDSLDQEDVSLICWSMARFGMLHTRMIRTLYRHCDRYKLVEVMTPNQVAQMMWSAAMLSSRSNTMMFELQQAASRQAHRMGPLALSNVMW